MKLENAQPQEQAQKQPAPHYEKSQGHQTEDKDIFDEIDNSYVAATIGCMMLTERIQLLMWFQHLLL